MKTFCNCFREQSIISVGDASFIEEKCVNAENLDMSLNLFTDINTILQILHLMPKLRSVHMKGKFLIEKLLFISIIF